MSVFAALWLVAAVAAGDTPTPDKLLDSWDRGCRLIDSYDVYMEVREETLLDARDWTPLSQPLVSSGASRQIRFGQKRRFEANARRPHETGWPIVVWDGELAKTYHAPLNQLTISAELITATPGAPDYEALYRTAAGTTALSDVIRQRPRKVVERQEGSQFVLYTPAIQGNFNFSPFGYRVWLDSEKNFLPSRVQTLIELSGKEILHGQRDNTLEEVEPGVWAVVTTVMKNFPLEKPETSEPRVAMLSVAEIARDSSKFNLAIPSSTFEIDIPLGTRVFDHVAGTVYAYGEASDAASRLSERVLQGTAAADELKTLEGSGELRPAPGSGSRAASTYYWLIRINLAVVVLLTLACVYFFFSRRFPTKMRKSS